jgi:hypothetical protein
MDQAEPIPLKVPRDAQIVARMLRQHCAHGDNIKLRADLAMFIADHIDSTSRWMPRQTVMLWVELMLVLTALLALLAVVGVGSWMELPIVLWPTVGPSIFLYRTRIRRLPW